jgi:hypothetical protein
MDSLVHEFQPVSGFQRFVGHVGRAILPASRLSCRLLCFARLQPVIDRAWPGPTILRSTACCCGAAPCPASCRAKARLRRKSAAPPIGPSQTKKSTAVTGIRKFRQRVWGRMASCGGLFTRLAHQNKPARKPARKQDCPPHIDRLNSENVQTPAAGRGPAPPEAVYSGSSMDL